MSDTESRRLCDLRVVDLRVELEKRSLDKTGVKQVLVERLQKALKDEGLDPDTYQFELNEKKSSKRPSLSKEVEGDLESSQTEKVTEEQEVATESTDSPSKNKSSDKHQEENVTGTKSDYIQAAKSSELEESAEMQGNDKNEQKSKDDNIQDTESPIRLILEEDDNFHDDEAEQQEPEKQVEEPQQTDVKNSNNKSADVEVTTKEDANDTTHQEDKKETKGSGTSNGKSSGKDKKQSSNQNRNLWITNISKTTRATELKQALSEYGKVIGAKVVTNARYPGACCYGYVTMDTVADADRVIEKLDNTELNGQIIKIEKVRPDHMNPLKLPNRKSSTEAKDIKDKDKRKSHDNQKIIEKKKDEKLEKTDRPKDSEKNEKKDEKHTDKRSEKGDTKKLESERKSRSQKRSHSHDRSRDRSRKSGSRHRHDRSLSSKSKRERREKDVLTFDKIKEERERQRIREQERILRDQQRRRREEAERQKEIERRQRSEAQRLEIEREKLRIEREKIEREKAELIRLERERQKLEREKLELEKLEIQRAKMRLQEEDRRTVKRSTSYRREGSYEDRKRSVSDRHFDEAPPPPRFDGPASVKVVDSDKKFSSSGKDYKSRLGYDKHDSYSSKRDRDYDSDRTHQSLSSRPPPTAISKYDNSNVFNLGRDRDMRTDPRGRDNTSGAVSSSRVPKDSRYSDRDRDRSPHFRPIRDDRDRRGVTEHSKTDMRSSRDHRYTESSKDTGRFERSSSNSWSHSTGSSKMFNSNSGSTTNKPWAKDSWRPNAEPSASSDRWSSTNSTRNSGIGSGGGFTSNSNINMVPTCPPPPGLNNYPSDRYDYKSLGSNMRKY